MAKQGTNRRARVPRPWLTALATLGGALALSLSAGAQDIDDDDFFGDEGATLEDFGTDFEPYEEDELETFGAYEGEFLGPRVRSASGRIDRLDLSEGRLVIEGRTYRADPRALQGLQPGQHVSLLYEPIEDQAWISELRLSGEGFGVDPYLGF